MTESERTARIVEVFPMRLGNESLVDVTVLSDGEFPLPRPDDAVRLPTAGGEIEAPAWAVPRVPRPDGDLSWNVQFRLEDLGGAEIEAGGRISW